jgi:hypothetical protein
LDWLIVPRKALPLQKALRYRGRGIAQAVEFVGWVPPSRVPELINSSTLVVMPSREDSFSRLPWRLL